MSDFCRCCGNQLDENPILIYHNMPKNAQDFLTEEQLLQDQGVELVLRQCTYCGLIQIAGDPVPYFRQVIRAAEFSDEMYLFRKKQFAELLRKYRLAGKKIIEIGAGCGEYMRIFQETGAQIYGLEQSAESVAKATAKGLEVYQGFLESEKEVIQGAPYDAACCFNFLEHIPNPNDFIKGMFQNLTEDAVAMLEVPNVNMLLEKNLFSEFISDHLMYFTKETLRILMEKNGFEILECNEIWYHYIISIVVRKRKRADLSSFYAKRKKIAEEIDSYLEKKKDQKRKVAVWGAGHQALTVLALADMEGKIECIIDSAPFKQQKYTPGTHISVVAPTVLAEGNIGAVLVLAAGYSDEVAGIMKKEYPAIEVAILRDYGIENIRY